MEKETEVEIYRDESLGMGSYGRVCKAKFGELICAAKFLHPILFRSSDPNSQDAILRFEQECQFLSDIHHPNVIQYLGKFWDRETGLPVLLMELMNESLTRFLERSATPVPFHTQANMCHDIALALTYLHSRGLIHRDLSSNNILLTVGMRAKVTDFGMSKLADTNIQFAMSLTQCPGCPQYMPPEAMKQPPTYTNKLDCFSWGVLAIQIMTRKFPSPGESTQAIDDPQYPSGTILRTVRESERRKADIDLIDPTHPLLNIALECLNHNESDRPTAKQLCGQLSHLELGTRYQEDIHQTGELQHPKVLALQHKLKEMEQQVQWQEKLLAEQQQLLTQKKTVHADLLQHLSEKQEEVDGLKLKITQRLRTVSLGSSTEVDATAPLEEFNTPASPSETTAKRLHWKPHNATLPKQISRGTSISKGSMAYFCGRGEKQVYMFNSRNNKWTALQECPSSSFSLAIVNGLPTAIGGFQNGRPTNNLFTYIEGKRGAEWEVRFYPPMPTKRCNPAAVTSEKALIVAGGETKPWGGNKVNSVEVMTTNDLQWLTVTQLPKPLSLMSAAVCKEELYLLGGVDDNSIATDTVLSCSVPALLKTGKIIRRPSFQRRQQTACIDPNVWQECAPLPVYNATATTISGQMLSIGGCDSNEDPTAAVYIYDKSESKWDLRSIMPTPRSSCLAVVMPSEKVLIAGGFILRGVRTSTNTVVQAFFV